MPSRKPNDRGRCFSQGAELLVYTRPNVPPLYDIKPLRESDSLERGCAPPPLPHVPVIVQTEDEVPVSTAWSAVQTERLRPRRGGMLRALQLYIQTRRRVDIADCIRPERPHSYEAGEGSGEWGQHRASWRGKGRGEIVSRPDVS